MSWASLSQARRDALYNNAAAVADSARLIGHRNDHAAAYRAANSGRLDLGYGDGARAKWDLFPAANPEAPCMVFIHGGYWQMNRREDFAHLAAGVAAHGWAAALPGYPLAPDASLTHIVAALRQALDWLAASGPAHGIAGKIYLAGWSAGAHLAALLLAHPAVTAGLGISGVYELGPLRETYLNEKLQLSDAEIEHFSPLRLPATEKPFAIAYGTAELPPLVADSQNLHARRAAAHAPGPLLPVAGADHFTILDELADHNGQLVHLLLDMAR